MFKTFINAWRVPELRKKILYTLLLLAIFRFGAFITAPGVDAALLNQITNTNSFVSTVNIITGGAFSNLSIFASDDITNQYFFLGGDIIPDFDDCGLKNYVSVDKYGIIVGYICYRYDATTRRAYSFGAINFTGNRITFGMDMMALLKRLFLVYNARTVEFRAIKDNPVNQSYRSVVEHIGGMQTGVLHNVFATSDGVIHNMDIYEIFRYSFAYMLTGSKRTTVNGRTAKFEEAVPGSRINKLEESPCTKFWCYQDYISVEKLKELGVFRYGINYTPLVIEGDKTPIAEMRHQLVMRGVEFATLVGQTSPTRFVVMHRGV